MYIYAHTSMYIHIHIHVIIIDIMMGITISLECCNIVYHAIFYNITVLQYSSII